MNFQRNKYHGFLSIILIAFSLSCTKSPLSESSKISSNTITGTVELSDGSIPGKVLVWFRIFDIGTRTDEQGQFSLTIPQPSEQPAGGLDGVFYLYFYMANYQVDSVSVAIFNGNIQASTEGITGNGELEDPVELTKILSIRANMNKHNLLDTVQDTVRIVYTVRALGDPVEISAGFSNPAFQGDPQYLIGFVRNIDPEVDFCLGVYREDRGHRTALFEIDEQPTDLLPLEIIVTPGTYAPGDYKIIPDIQVHQENIPKGLLETLKTGSQNTCDDFFNVPLVVGDNDLTVVPGN